MRTINIKGKPYVMVNERIKEFRENYKGWSLVSEIVQLTEDNCVIKASVIDDKGVLRATGYAQEDKASSIINKTSYIENCETSAWGRALGNLGIGIDESIASAEEVNLAIAKQNLMEEPKTITIQQESAKCVHCTECDEDVSQKVAEYSLNKFGRILCYDCQKMEAGKDE